MAAEKGTSVLASLTATVMGEKVAAARPQLTPVAGEAHTPGLPNDTGLFMSNERLRTHAAELRKFAGEAIAIADGLDAMSGLPDTVPETPVSLDAIRKEKEAEADAKAATQFDIEMAAKAAAAQAAVFTGPTVEEDVAAVSMPNVPALPPEVDGWVCPLHGKAITKTSNKSGREYRGCPDCNLFER